MSTTRFHAHLAVALAAGFGLAVTAALPSAGLAAAGDANCRALTGRAMDGIRSSLRSGYTAAQADARKNGSNGAYAVAATNSQNLIKRALDRAETMFSQHGSSRSVSAAEAGTIKEHARAIIEVLPEAAHWATISEIYHDSPDALAAYEGAVAGLAQGQALFADAGRCYMAGL
ncbi:MAG: hypothetical protein R3195_12095 [Gemmatimonadota bacterium]|nr:hypothetical protein [Gemmatimonadota bacterium]